MSFAANYIHLHACAPSALTHSTICFPPSLPHTPQPYNHRPSFSSSHIPIRLLSILALNHLTQRPLLDHKRHDLVQRIRRGHRRMLGIGIVRRRDLDDVGGDEVDAFEASDDGAQFARRPAACFGGAGGWGDYDVTTANVSMSQNVLRVVAARELGAGIQAGSKVSISMLK